MLYTQTESFKRHMQSVRRLNARLPPWCATMMPATPAASAWARPTFKCGWPLRPTIVRLSLPKPQKMAQIDPGQTETQPSPTTGDDLLPHLTTDDHAYLGRTARPKTRASACPRLSQKRLSTLFVRGFAPPSSRIPPFFSLNKKKWSPSGRPPNLPRFL